MGTLVWLRRDLRCEDQAALHHALREGGPVHCAFVFDREILDRLPERADRRVEFIRESLVELDRTLDVLSRRAGGRGAGLIVRHGFAREEIPALARELGVSAVHANRDYEPAARRRDADVAARLAADGVAFHEHKDQVVFERDQVLTGRGTPYTVFTPYRRAWEARLDELELRPLAVAPYAAALAPRPLANLVPTLDELGFLPTNLASIALPPGESGGFELLREFLGRIDRYHEVRNFPAVRGVSCLSTHLRFGTVSIRELVREARRRPGDGPRCWLGELIWREFFQQLLWHYPRVVDTPFREECEGLRWERDPAGFAAWCEGRTGYPLVDAAMRQLNTTGYMHNRLRMVAASFLCKDLGIDWREGERYFANRLNDYDLASNNGGWQWAASTGCDAQPWFRIFNPVAQSRKFDPEGRFIRRHVPELRGFSERAIHAPWMLSADRQQAAGCVIGRDYPAPMVDHAAARARTLQRFGVLRGGADRAGPRQATAASRGA